MFTLVLVSSSFSTKAGMTARIDRTYIQRQRGVDRKVKEVECFRKWECKNAKMLRVLFHIWMFGDTKCGEGLEIIGCCLNI